MYSNAYEITSYLIIMCMYIKVSAPELISSSTGEAEERIRELFAAAIENAPSVLFIDALDVIAGKKEVSYNKNGSVDMFEEFVMPIIILMFIYIMLNNLHDYTY